MSGIAVLGAGAFGTALAAVLAAAGKDVRLWGRDSAVLDQIDASKTTPKLPGVQLPPGIQCLRSLADVQQGVVLLAIPMQKLDGFLVRHSEQLAGRSLVACCKGIDLESGRGPTGIIADRVPSATAAILTGPSFAADIARGLPTALTLACRDDGMAKSLQDLLSAPTLRLYRWDDVTGAELGGALKNVIAIACGIVVGAGLGESARAALMTRGFAEMRRLGTALGARPETLMGLSGMGDLVLTCSSEQSRNYAFGLSVGRGGSLTAMGTVEGVATAHAAMELARRHRVDMPITAMVSAILKNQLTLEDARTALLARAQKEE